MKKYYGTCVAFVLALAFLAAPVFAGGKSTFKDKRGGDSSMHQGGKIKTYGHSWAGGSGDQKAFSAGNKSLAYMFGQGDGPKGGFTVDMVGGHEANTHSNTGPVDAGGGVEIGYDVRQFFKQRGNCFGGNCR